MSPRMPNLRVLLAAALLCLWWSGAARAHANLVSSDPAEGAIVAATPQHLTLTFNETVEPLALRIITPAGGIAPVSDFGVRGNAVIIAAPRTLGTGTHLLSWRVVSADGHPVGGTLTFSIGAASAAPQAAGIETDASVRAAILALRFAVFLGLFAGVGGAFFIAWFAASDNAARAKTPLVIASVVALLAVPLSVGLQGLDAVAASYPALMSRAIWIAGLQTAYGPTAIVASLSLLLAMISFGSSAAPARWLALAAVSGAGCALALSGHAASAAPRLLTVPAVFVHGVGVAIWIGALLPLAAALRDDHPNATALLARFSRVIPFVVLLLLISGGTLAIVQVVQLDALWNTNYGRVLCLKLALLVLLFILAAINRWRLTRRVMQKEAQAIRLMRRVIAAEIVVVVAIFGAVSLWRFTPPPRALADYGQSIFTHIHTERAMADVSITPPRAGPVTAAIALRTPDEVPLDAMEVAVIFSNPQAGIEPITRQAEKTGQGQWRVATVALPVPGAWTIELKILITDFELVTLRASIAIGRDAAQK